MGSSLGNRRTERAVCWGTGGQSGQLAGEQGTERAVSWGTEDRAGS